tara:strand:- start:1787 stop:2650 length:864 start_codon:yes stop_codon:yes gene_type:complete
VRILIADSNVLFARLVRLKLEKWGHKVDTALTGAEAWDLARRNNYRVVILDWPLEVIDGGRLCRQVRNLDRGRYTYILFYSERSDHESVMEAFEAGTDDYLFKPFNPLILKLRLKTGKRLLNLEDELLSIASFDPQTGLINYETFARFFRTHLAGAVRFMESGTLMSVRLVNYRDVFETHGYDAATKLMIEISRILPTHLRAADLVARVTDDSYFILLPQTPIENADTVMQKLEADIAEIAVFAGMTEIRARVAIDHAGYPQEVADPDQIMAHLMPSEASAVRRSAN